MEEEIVKKNSRKLLLIIMVISVLGLGGCAGEEAPQTDTLKDVLEAGVLRVAVTDNNGAYSYIGSATNQLTGIEISMMKSFGEYLGVTVDYVILNQDGLVEAVMNGEADLAIGRICYDGIMEKDSVISDCYGTGNTYAVTRRGVFSATLGAFEEQTIGLSKGVSPDVIKTTSEIRDASRKENLTREEAAIYLENGAIGGFFCREEDARYFMANPQLQAQVITNLPQERYVAAGRADAQALMNEFNKWLIQATEDGTMDQWNQVFRKQ